MGESTARGEPPVFVEQKVRQQRLKEISVMDVVASQDIGQWFVNAPVCSNARFDGFGMQESHNLLRFPWFFADVTRFLERPCHIVREP